MTWGHVGALALVLVLALGAAASAVLRADPPAVARSEPEIEAAPASETVWVSLIGDAEQVELVRGARRIRLPARVAPGTWNLSVRFPGTSASMDRGSVDVRAGLNVRCEADFMRCGG